MSLRRSKVISRSKQQVLALVFKTFLATQNDIKSSKRILLNKEISPSSNINVSLSMDIGMGK
jgi:hypothetical protein